MHTPSALEALFDALSLGFILLDSQGRVKAMNRAMADLIGGQPGGSHSKRWIELIFPDDRSAAMASVRSLMTGESRELSFECRYVNRAGLPVWCSTVLAVVSNGTSNLRRVAGLVSNITERRQWTKERARLEAQLSRAQKMENVGMIAGGVAHNLNNFLEVVLGFASLARLRLPPDEEFQEPVRMIEDAARHAGELTGQLLELAREDTAIKQSANPSEALDRVLKIVRRTFDRKIQIRSRIGSGLPWIHVDPRRLEQAILNLAINARDAMPEGGILSIEASRMTVRSRRIRALGSRRPGDYVQIAVKDTGSGMEPKVLRRIFEPLFTTKPDGEGTGLGLAMTRKTVDISGGFLEVKSKPGKGSSFLLYFPVTEARPGATGAAHPALRRGRGTILVVDDEPMVRDFLEKGLQYLGYTVLAADNGAQACELYAAHSADIECVLLDMVMPGMTGLEIYDRLRILDPEVKVILSSGYNRRTLGESVPSTDFLSKPYTIESLSVAIKKVREEQ